MAFDQIQIKEPAAVVVVNRKPDQVGLATDIDPIYLIRDGDTWWVLPEMTSTSSASQIIEPSRAKVFGELEAWFDKRLNQ